MSTGRTGPPPPTTLTLTESDAAGRDQTISLDAVLDLTRGTVDLHLAAAARQLAAGDGAGAFAEIKRAARAAPMSWRVASAMVRVALVTGEHAQALTLLNQGLDEAEGRELSGALRAVARLHRRLGDLDRAREHLVLALAQVPGDGRARAALNGLLEREQQWEELDASLEKEARVALKAGASRRAVRATARRARLASERLGDPARAALRYGQAAQLALQGGEDVQAYVLQGRALEALVASQAPARALAEGVQRLLQVAGTLGTTERAQVFLQGLGLLPTEPSASGPSPGAVATPPHDEAPGAATARDVKESSPFDEADDPEVSTGKHDPEEGPATVLEMPVVVPPPRPPADLASARKLEAQFVGRGDWAGLEAFYLDRAARAVDHAEKAGWFEKLAEVLETELEDLEGAAAAWGEVAALGGDDRARREQLRLLGRVDGGRGIQGALDEGVARAESPEARAQALVTRAEKAVERGDVAAAGDDVEAALRLQPDSLPALALAAELAGDEGGLAPVRRFQAVLEALPRGAPGRLPAYRRLGRVALATLGLARLARAAWAAVWAESPEDREAQEGLLVAARALRDDPLVEQLLRRALARDARGPGARAGWMELVGLLERHRRVDEALATLRQAVGEDPAHLAAWMALGDRLVARADFRGGLEALEQAAAAAQGHQRMTLWRRLERLARDHLDDLERAATYAARAARVKEELGPDDATQAGPLGGPLLAPRPPRPRRNPFDDVARALGAQEEADVERAPRLYSRFPVVVQGPAPATPGLEETVEAAPAPVPAPATPVREGEVIVDPSLWADAARQGQDAPARVALGDAAAPLAQSFGPSPQAALSEERAALFEHVRANPLAPDGYKALAEHFDAASDATRSSLMLEIARALEGDPHAAPRAPRLILSEADRVKLRHPALRGEAGELLSLVGLPLCRLYPATGAAASEDEFSLEAGKGARPAADALLTAVRLLGVRAPEVFLTADPGAPFTAVHTTVPRLLISREAVKRPLADAALRFYAGRALFALSPDLLLLRSVRREQLLLALQVVAEVAASRATSAEARVVRGALSTRAFERVRQLWPKVGRALDLAGLSEAARHSVNRAGLVVCGGVAPALDGLRSKKARPAEVVELVRFAASETYLQLKGRHIGKG